MLGQSTSEEPAQHSLDDRTQRAVPSPNRSGYTRRNSSMCCSTRRKRGDSRALRGRYIRAQISTPAPWPAGEPGANQEPPPRVRRGEELGTGRCQHESARLRRGQRTGDPGGDPVGRTDRQAVLLARATVRQERSQG